MEDPYERKGRRLDAASLPKGCQGSGRTWRVAENSFINQCAGVFAGE